MNVSRVSEMREMDKAAIREFGISDELLMENAGNAAWFALMNEVSVRGRRFLVVSGPGNNGGDGFVLARKIYSAGGLVKVIILGDSNRFKGAAQTNFNIVSKLEIPLLKVDSLDSIAHRIDESDVIIDAILGTGLTREVQGLYREAIECINRSDKPVLSLDIPSGISGENGLVMGAAVKADFTVTFGLPKVGNLLYPGFEHCGRLYVSHISFPPTLTQSDELEIEIQEPVKLPPRDPNGHKGTFGDVLFVAGASSYYGAPYFSAMAFLKAGGGYARLAAPRSMVPLLANKGSEIVFAPQEETASGSLSMANHHTLLSLSKQTDLLILGPGLSLDEEAQHLARVLAGDVTQPLLLDGDGITALCHDLDILRKREGETILTPHLGEMGRITGLTVDEIRTDPIAVLQRTTADIGAIIVLKGAHSLIGYPEGRVVINVSGNSGMATAGSGDVLTGTVAAMFGLGLDLPDAVRQGVFLHGVAGDLAASDCGEDGMTAQDILEHLPAAVRMSREDFGDSFAGRYRVIDYV